MDATNVDFYDKSLHNGSSVNFHNPSGMENDPVRLPMITLKNRGCDLDCARRQGRPNYMPQHHFMQNKDLDIIN
jgi:hypothetical protein